MASSSATSRNAARTRGDEPRDNPAPSTTVRAVNVPIMYTSPWAKLISSTMPYTSVYPSATRANSAPFVTPKISTCSRISRSSMAFDSTAQPAPATPSPPVSYSAESCVMNSVCSIRGPLNCDTLMVVRVVSPFWSNDQRPSTPS